MLQNPLNLKETMEKYYDAYFVLDEIHSVVLQTVLNGEKIIYWIIQNPRKARFMECWMN